jgi:4-hydroxy-tetrahydrodipicolinate synthase
VRTGRPMAVDTVVRLANEVPNIVGLKDARGNPYEAARVVAGVPDSFDVYSGDDSLTLPLLAVGAVGAVGVATHWIGPFVAEMVAAFDKGDHVAAREVNARLLDSYAYESTDLWQHASGVKALLQELGLPSGPCRPPLPPVPDEARQRARAIIATLGVTK